MFYGDTILETRDMFFLSWEKYHRKELLSCLENEIVQVILDHPEYHKIFEEKYKFQQHTYYPELGDSNPFLHMGLHLAIREQVATDRPMGIGAVFQNLISKYHHSLIVEHLMMDQLAECLWLAQKNHVPPDENHYLHSLTALLE